MKERLKRQSFLGETSDVTLQALRVAIVGLGGGGSHIAQQAAHVGVGEFLLIDLDRIDETNLNRLIGGTDADLRRRAWKTAIAARQIRRVNPGAKVTQIRADWKSKAALLRDFDVIFGCVDTFAARRDLEAAARRYLIPYIDIGMDVFGDAFPYSISGQVALSTPGRPCLRCMGILTDARLAKEAELYGAAGGHPQVVWPNGVLASLAVGVFMQLVTPWNGKQNTSVLLEYDGNSQEVNHSLGLSYLPDSCGHFSALDDLGDPWFEDKN